MKTDSGALGEIVVVGMFSREDVIEGLQSVIAEYGFRFSVILFLIGTLSEVELRYFVGRPQGLIHADCSGHYELTNGDGDFYESEERIVVHIHVNLASSD